MKTRNPAGEFVRHWQFLEPFFRPIVVKLFVPWFAILPIALTILADVPRTIQIPTLPPSTLTMALPFKWWLLWWASFLYTIAYILYLSLGPAFIRRYKSFAKYREAMHSPRWVAAELEIALRKIHDHDELVGRLSEKGFATIISPTNEPVLGRHVRNSSTDLVFEHSSNRYVLRAVESDGGSNRLEREVFWEIFEQFAKSRPCARISIWVLLAISALLFSIAVVQNISTVLEKLFF